MKNKKLIGVLIGPVLFLLCFLLPDTMFSDKGRIAVATVVWMSAWWITMPVSPAVTAFLPIAVNALFSVCPMADIIKQYAAELVILLLGANMITISWEKTGLDKRLALRALNLIGPSVRQQMVVWLLISTVMSSILPNAVVVAVLTPIAVSMLRYIGYGEIDKHKSSSLILLAIAWGANNGGMASPLGGSMNLVALESIENFLGHEFIYADWVVKMLPFTLAITVLSCLFIFFQKAEVKTLEGSKEYFRNLQKSQPPMTRAELISLILFLTAVVISFTRELYASILPDLKPAYAFLICGLLTFIISADGKPLLTWKESEKSIMWEMIYIFAGGTALGTLVNNSGAAKEIASLLTGSGIGNGFLTIFIVVAFIIILSDVVNNVSAAAISIPIIIALAQALNYDVIAFTMIGCAAYNVSYTLPTSIRAVPVGYGLKPDFMMKRGIGLSVLVIIAVSVIGWITLGCP
ncbi:MAG: anion permease [Clostridia bacterium]|nr:anion permease [Clostridia bacterium]